MHEDRLGRRQMLRRASVITGGVVVASAAVASPALADGSDSPGLVGGWLVDREDPDIDVRAHGVFTFAAGGVVHYQDIFVLNAILHGSWKAGSGRTFRYEMWGGLPADPATGAPALTVRVAGPGTYTRRTFTNPYVVTLFDAASGTEFFSYEGVAKGTRIEP